MVLNGSTFEGLSNDLRFYLVSLKNLIVKISDSKVPVVCLCVGGMLGGDLGVDGGWMPLPTRPQQYCDPASRVRFLFHLVTCVDDFRQLVGQSLTFEKWLSSNTLAKCWWRQVFKCPCPSRQLATSPNLAAGYVNLSNCREGECWITSAIK